MRIFEHANYPFVQNRRKAYYFSLAVTLIGLASFAIRGFEWGIDFTGGKEFIVETTAPVEVTQAREALATALGRAPEVKRYDENILVRTEAAGSAEEIGNRISARLNEAVPGANARVLRSDEIAPRFAADLQRGAIYAVLASLLVVFVYVLFRFEWTYGVGVVVAAAHDVFFALALFSLLHGILPFSLQIDQTVIAAFLTIVGYSINDTVVVFDRIREDRARLKNVPLEEVMNRSINATLSRTIITGGSTLLTLVVLFIFAGEVVRGFAFALVVGILVGTYSSVFVAAPIVIEVQKWADARRVAPKASVTAARL